MAGRGAQVLIKRVSFLREAPPRIQVSALRTSRYVKDVTLDGLQRELRHPFVAISQEEIARARTKGRVYQDYVTGLRRGGRPLRQGAA